MKENNYIITLTSCSRDESKSLQEFFRKELGTINCSDIEVIYFCRMFNFFCQDHDINYHLGYCQAEENSDKNN